MKNHVIAGMIGVFALAGITSGCATYPETEMEAARTALATADSAEADVYVQDLYAAAADSFAAAEEEVDAQKGLPPQDRSFEGAKSLLAYVTETATLATSQVDNRKEVVRVEAEQLIAEAEQLLAAQQTQAPTSAVQAAEGTTVSDPLAQAKAELAAGDFAAAHATASMLVETLKSAQAPAETTVAPRS